MPKHTPDERVGLQGRVFVLAIAVVGVIKVYALRAHVQRAFVAHWPTLDVACQIQGHASPVCIRLADLDVPVPGVLPADALAPVLRIVLGRQLQAVLGQGVAQACQELATKQGAQGFDRHQVIAQAATPLVRIVQATGADQAVHMRVQAQGAPPGVQGHQQARCGAQVARVAAQLQEAGARAVERQRIGPCPVEFPQGQEVVRECEDAVKVRARQQLVQLSLHPLVVRSLRATGATAVAAGVVHRCGAATPLVRRKIGAKVEDGCCAGLHCQTRFCTHFEAFVRHIYAEIGH